MLIYLLYLLLQVSSEGASWYYLGTWSGKFVDYLEPGGRCYVDIDTDGINYYYQIIVFDGEYESRPYVSISGNITDYSSKAFKIVNGNVYDTIGSYSTCQVNGEVYIENDSLSGTINSSNCDVNLDLQVEVLTQGMYYTDKIIYLGLFVLAKTMEFIALRKIFAACTFANVARGADTISIVLSATLDIFYLLWNVQLAVTGYVSLI